MSQLRLPLQRLRDERGFTLIELLVAMTLVIVILLATLTMFDSFNRGAAANSRLTDSEDTSRRDVANMVRILRDAGAPAPVTGPTADTFVRASVNDIVFRSTSWPGESAAGITGTHVQRLCLDSASKKVIFEGLRAGTAGPTDPGASCPSSALGWTRYAIAQKVANTAALPLFRISAGTVRSIGVQLRSESGTTTTSRPLPLSSGGTPRGALAPQVTNGDIGVRCDSDGSGKPLLSLAATTPNLSLSASGAIALGPGKILLDLTGNFTTTVTLTVTNALGLQKLLFKEVSC